MLRSLHPACMGRHLRVMLIRAGRPSQVYAHDSDGVEIHERRPLEHVVGDCPGLVESLVRIIAKGNVVRLMIGPISEPGIGRRHAWPFPFGIINPTFRSPYPIVKLRLLIEQHVAQHHQAHLAFDQFPLSAPDAAIRAYVIVWTEFWGREDTEKAIADKGIARPIQDGKVEIIQMRRASDYHAGRASPGAFQLGTGLS